MTRPGKDTLSEAWMPHVRWGPRKNLRFDVRYDNDGETAEIIVTFEGFVIWLSPEQARELMAGLGVALVHGYEDASAIEFGTKRSEDDRDPWALSTPDPKP